MWIRGTKTQSQSITGEPNNMRTIRTKVYKFSELSEPAKQTALNNEIQSMIEYEFKDHYENWPAFQEACDKCEQMETPCGMYVRLSESDSNIALSAICLLNN